MTLALPNVSEQNSLFIQRTFFSLIHLGQVAETIIAYLFYFVDVVVFLYIPLSISLYLIFFKILMSLKLFILRGMNNCSVCVALTRLNSLEDLMVAFESHLSIVPLNWLFYGLSACLIYILVNIHTLQLTLPIIVSFIFQMLALFELLLTLYIVSKWQEYVDTEVDAFLRLFIGSSTTQVTDKVLQRVEKVMKKRVTVWYIFPIDRSLILGYIGSAITFSTLYMQLEAGKTSGRHDEL